jgi:hypothetical protein
MNIPMNDMEKIVAELHGMLKTAENSIKKNPNHVMKPRIAMSCMGCFQKEKKRKCWMPPKGKGKEKDSDEPSSSKP